MNILDNGKVIFSGSLIINDKKEILLLHRKDHNYYETPGGKLEYTDCDCENKITIKDLERCAIREIFEELGAEFMMEELSYFDNVTFSISDGRKAIAHKFITKILFGNPKINEEKFDKLKYIPIDQLDDYNISEDLKLLLPKLQERNNN